MNIILDIAVHEFVSWSIVRSCGCAAKNVADWCGCGRIICIKNWTGSLFFMLMLYVFYRYEHDGMMLHAPGTDVNE